MEPGSIFCCCSVAKLCLTLWLWTAARHAPLSSSISWSLLKFMSIELVMLSKHIILCHLLLLLLQSFLALGSFLMNQLFASDGQSIGASASVSVLPMNIQGWLPLGWTGLISLVFPTPHKVLWHSSFFMVQLTSVHDYWQKHSFDYTDFCQ